MTPFRARYRRGTNYTTPVADFYVNKIFSPAIFNITPVKDFASLFNKGGSTPYKGGKITYKGGSTGNKGADIFNMGGSTSYWDAEIINKGGSTGYKGTDILIGAGQ